MRRWWSGLLFLAASIGFVADAPAAGPAEVSAADAKAVRAVVEAQLKALAVDDAKAAFRFASPKIREAFGSPDNFLAMVRQGYPVVYRPASVAFLKAEKDAEGIVQAVHLTDADGTLWLAVYHLERQPDRSWRIGGCQVVPTEGRIA